MSLFTNRGRYVAGAVVASAAVLSSSALASPNLALTHQHVVRHPSASTPLKLPISVQSSCGVHCSTILVNVHYYSVEDGVIRQLSMTLANVPLQPAVFEIPSEHLWPHTFRYWFTAVQCTKADSCDIPVVTQLRTYQRPFQIEVGVF